MSEFNADLVGERDAQALKERLQAEGRATVVLLSGSMAPLLPQGACAIVENYRFENLKRFDMIIFQRGGRLICHAIWGTPRLARDRGPQTIMTWGLQNPTADAAVEESEIIAQVVSHRLSAWHVFLVGVQRGVSSLIDSPVFLLLLLVFGIATRFASTQAWVGLISLASVLTFTRFSDGPSRRTFGRVCALTLALSPFSRAWIGAAAPFVEIEAMSVLTLVTLIRALRAKANGPVWMLSASFVVAMAIIGSQSSVATQPTFYLAALQPIGFFLFLTMVSRGYRRLFRI